jgi:hypothetical protein
MYGTLLGIHNEAWTAIAAWATLGVLALSAAFALAQLWLARSLQKEEAKPSVVVDLDVDKRPHLIFLYFQNLGKTTAYDVRLGFDPPLEIAHDIDSVVHFFGRTFPTLPPGKRIESYFDSSIDRLSDDFTGSNEYTVTVTYRGRDNIPYTDKYTLDIEVFRGRLSVDYKTTDDVVKVLESMGDVMAKWSSGYGGIKAVTQSEDDADREHQEHQAERKAAHDELVKRLTPKAPPPETVDD